MDMKLVKKKSLRKRDEVCNLIESNTILELPNKTILFALSKIFTTAIHMVNHKANLHKFYLLKISTLTTTELG